MRRSGPLGGPAQTARDRLKSEKRFAVRPLGPHVSECATIPTKMLEKKKCKKVKNFHFFDFFSACPMNFIKNFLKFARPADDFS